MCYSPALSPEQRSIRELLRHVHQGLYLHANPVDGDPITTDALVMGYESPADDSITVKAFVPPCRMEDLGDPSFCAEHGIRFPYAGGSMAKGISSVAMVEELGKAGMLGFFGAAGLPLATVEAAIDRLAAGDFPFGINLIHSPHEPDLEQALAELFIRKKVRLVEASAFLALSLPLVRYRLHGIHRSHDGRIVAPNRIIAKVSREELAEKFFSPPPEKLLRELLAQGAITPEQAEMAASIPMAQDITAEADSGGHTDNRPALALFPTIQALSVRMQPRYGNDTRLRVGLGGGIGTPAAAAAAFAMGAAYIMTGSVHQACVESGTSDAVREMLAATRQADVTMAPAADMFEMGVTVQVLKRGTMFPMRAARLYEIYRSCASLDDIAPAERDKLEKTFFKASLEEIWQQTRSYFLHRDPRQVERGDRDPKHRMALVFRWYLGQAAHWAQDGDPARAIDYQIWCGPAMGAFNEWVADSFLADPQKRRVVTVARNILFGATIITRANFLRCQGVNLPDDVLRQEPLTDAQIKEYVR
ncbi:MAG: PfaD family polyunsaturated fatty acid/polyketide biosynthesis protein [Geobacter sp.]|nr:PfaD family polyunsaturated fatty acid/polyketide biosynthesis protein [Geobacter sp.]